MSSRTITPPGHHVDTRLGRLHVRSAGEGTPTVLWPSMFVDSHTWDPILPLLPDGRRYLLVDGPGLGFSDALRRASDVTEASDAAVDLLDALGTGPVDWVGNAFGGHVGFKLATRPGVLRSLVAISSPAEPISLALRSQIKLLLPVLWAFGPVGPVRESIVAAMLTEASASVEPVRRIVEEALMRPTRRSLARAVRSFILNRTDVTSELPGIGVPSLFVASDDRGDWSPEAAVASAGQVLGAEAVVVTGARTLIPLEQPDALAARLRAFWSRLDPEEALP